jgi:hypothetical protein
MIVGRQRCRPDVVRLETSLSALCLATRLAPICASFPPDRSDDVVPETQNPAASYWFLTTFWLAGCMGVVLAIGNGKARVSSARPSKPQK